MNMHPDFQRLMQDATRLVRGGDLQAATAAIRDALQGASGDESARDNGRHDNDASRRTSLVLDVEAREIPTPAAGDEQPPAASDGTIDGNGAGDSDGTRDPAGDAQGEGSFVSGRHGVGRGARDYKLYIPPQAGQQPLPLVVMLHGCTQNPDDFAAGTRMNEAARGQGCFVLYPAQSQEANPQRCWNWFKHSHQQRGRGEAAILASMTQKVMAQHAIDPRRVYVAGLSAGGAMAAILGHAYPDLFAAVGVHSGLASGAANDLPSALGAMRSGRIVAGSAAAAIPTIVFHGDADNTVHPDNAGHVVRASAARAHGAAQVHRERAAGGRGYTRHVHRSLQGEVLAEHWVVHGSGHAWSGGSRAGSYTDPAGPDATQQMLRFFLEHPRR